MDHRCPTSKDKSFWDYLLICFLTYVYDQGFGQKNVYDMQRNKYGFVWKSESKVPLKPTGW